MTGSERQARFRARNAERLNQERRAARERERINELGIDPACFCCGEVHLGFLLSRHGRVVCRNCDHMIEAWGYCPHAGIRLA